MKIRNIAACAGVGTMMGYTFFGIVLGEYAGISAACSYLLPYNHTSQDVDAYHQCRIDTVNDLGVDPGNPGVLNAFLNKINLSFAAAGFVVGLGYGIYREIKDGCLENNIHNSDLEQGVTHYSRLQEESKVENKLTNQRSFAGSDLGIFKTAKGSYEIYNSHFYRPENKKQTNPRYAHDDLELTTIQRKLF